MTPLFRRTRDKAFAAELIQHNMAGYHRRLGLYWNDALFTRHWQAQENYQLIIEAQPVGLLCIHRDAEAYHIRELQIAPAWQRRGFGAAAIRFTHQRARQAGIDCLRLQVYRINPARALYERMGFQIHSTVGHTHYMERPVS